MKGWSEYKARSTLEFDNNPDGISSAKVLLCVIIEVHMSDSKRWGRASK